MKIDLRNLRAYGDRLNDGKVLLSFTFPYRPCEELKEAAKIYVKKMGFLDPLIARMEDVGNGFTMFIVYAMTKASVDLKKIRVPKLDYTHMDYKTLSEFMSKNLDRQLVVVGGTTGSDAHTVGLDAIMNMKGYNHDYGLERYQLFKTYNLRSQLTNKELLDKAYDLKADVIMVSQIVTQRDSHIDNLREFIKMIDHDSRFSKDLILIIGGPRLDHALALKMGFDAGFGSGTMPSQVASFIVSEYLRRKRIKVKG